MSLFMRLACLKTLQSLGRKTVLRSTVVSDNEIGLGGAPSGENSTKRKEDDETKSKEATKQSLNKGLVICFVRCSAISFLFIFSLLLSLMFAENSVMKQNRWVPLIC